MSSSSTIFTLTEDLLIRIFNKLDSESDRKSTRLVCKELNRVDSLTRKSLRILRVQFLLSLLRSHPNLLSLDLSLCAHIVDATIPFILRQLGRDSLSLKTLNLSRSTGLTHSGLEILMRACVDLQRLDVSHCRGYGDREAAAISFASELRELTMDKCLGISDVGLARIVISCYKLEKLSLRWCMRISDLVIHLLCNKCPQLNCLDFSYSKVTSESLRSVALLSNLETLAMVGCRFVDDDGLKFLENGCPLLQEIDVSRCARITSAGLISVIKNHPALLHLNAGHCFSELSTSFVNCLKNVKHLKTLSLDGCQISDFDFETLSTSCKWLIGIGLSKCLGVTNKGIMQLVSGQFDLKNLNLTCCDSITDAAISALADSCRNLESLKMESCIMITEKGIFQLGSFCLRLKELDLTDCCGVNDRGLLYVSRCSELSCLKLGLCTNISDKGLSCIGLSCSNLLELDLYRCTGIGDDGLGSLSSGCKKLKVLNLSYCTQVTDRGMTYVGSLEELSDFEMRGLLNVSSVGLAAVAFGCKKLADMDLKHCDNIDGSGFWALAYHARNLRQINLSYCAISDMALCMVMGNLPRLQDAKLVNLCYVSVDGFELALRACCARMKKVKLDSRLMMLISTEILESLDARGCHIRWD
ncbi:hypothetical protein ACFE04_005628 [Oxalis oulophora]